MPLSLPSPLPYSAPRKTLSKKKPSSSLARAASTTSNSRNNVAAEPLGDRIRTMPRATVPSDLQNEALGELYTQPRHAVSVARTHARTHLHALGLSLSDCAGLGHSQ